MWQYLHLEHFKCFEKLSLPLSPLTLLSGLNASGKSSVLQSLALLHQTILDTDGNSGLLLNGSAIKLGTGSDVIDKSGGRKEFAIALEAENYRHEWRMLAEVKDLLVVPFKEKAPKEYDHLIKTLRNLIYLSAERLGPRETYAIRSLSEQRTVGVHGELTPWFLTHFANHAVLPELHLPEEDGPALRLQANAWLNAFFPGAAFDIQPVLGANQVTLRIRTNQADEFHRPQNVGYGLTHVLPILAACLRAEKGDVILIENPEAHLHPAGQAQMGSFLSRVAAAGVQVILETHSDHVLNGIRRMTKDKKLAPEQVALHFFYPRTEDESRAQVVSPLIDSEGNLSEWPEGFFDQFDKDTAYFAGWET